MATKGSATSATGKTQQIARMNKGAKPAPAPTPSTGKKKGFIPLPPPTEPQLWPKSEDPVSVMTIEQVADKSMRHELETRIREAFELKELAKQAKLRLEGVKANPKKGVAKQMGLMEEIAILQKELGIKTLYLTADDGRSIENTYYRGTSVFLNAAKLLQNGVSAEIIEASKDSKQYVTCQTKLKGAKDDE